MANLVTKGFSLITRSMRLVNWWDAGIFALVMPIAGIFRLTGWLGAEVLIKLSLIK
jgi:hypothetical protein